MTETENVVIPSRAGLDPPTRPRRSSWRLGSPVHRVLAALIVMFVAKQLFSVAAFPAFSGHDELVHFTYVEILATQARIPVLPDLAEWRTARRLSASSNPLELPGDDVPDDLYPYCRYTLDWHCAPDHPVWGKTPPRVVTVRGQYYPSGFVYTANHPLLYYLLMTPVYKATEWLSPVQQQYALRAAAIPLGLITVLLAFALARTLFPGDAFLAITVPAFVAFQPQISYEAAMVNNDVLSITILSWILLLLARGLRFGFSRSLSLWIGVALGLGLLTKSNMLIAAPVVGLAVLLAVGWNWRALLQRALWIGAPAAVLSAPWYLFLYSTYGNFTALPQISALQWGNTPAGSFLELLGSSDFLLMRFKETWGEYGWRMIHLSDGLLTVIGVVVLISILGMFAYVALVGRQTAWVRNDPVPHPEAWQWKTLIVLLVACALGYLAVVQFGTQFSLTQARYFFPIVNAAALLVMLGLRTLIPAACRQPAQGVIVGALLILNVVIFVDYVMPHHARILTEMPWLEETS